MAEATYLKDPTVIEITAPAALVNGQMLQLGDSRAALVAGAGAGIASGDLASVQVLGHARVAKTASIVILQGQVVWWDVSANKAIHSSVGGDFPIGVAATQSASATTTVDVDLNVEMRPRIQLYRDRFTTEATDGLGWSGIDLNDATANFDAVAEIGQAALFSQDSIPIAQKPIFEGVFDIADNGDDAALDINLGLANASHATDFDLVTESAVFHFNGTDLKVYAESDDGTIEVTATDTTLVYVVGTPFFIQIDCSDTADIQMYFNGVNVLPSSVFRLDAGTGPMLAMAHMEKASNNTLADLQVLEMWVRTGINL